jgi:unsaturated rhamnogalacturonyl hydrolase
MAGLGETPEQNGSFEYYMSEAVVENEAKGVAPLIMAYAEILRGE